MTATTPYTGIPNAFRRDLLAGKPLFGCWSSLANPITTEVLGLAGFDWLLLDGEHAPNDVGTLIPQLMALKDSRSAPVVRPPWNDAVVIKRLLDAGFYNFLIPFVETEAEAQARGRGRPATRRPASAASRWRSATTATARSPTTSPRVNDHVCVLVQIESGPGLAAIDAIAAVDGVDGIFVGPSDLAAALGHLGKAGHPDVQQAIRHVFARARAQGKPSGILAPVEADARRYLEWGATFVAVGSDLGLFRAATQALRDKFAAG